MSLSSAAYGLAEGGLCLACNFCPSRIKVRPIYEHLLKKKNQKTHSSVKILAAKKAIIAAGNHEDLIFSDHAPSLHNSRCWLDITGTIFAE